VLWAIYRSWREANRAEVNLVENPDFAEFRGVIDGQMKKQNATGKYVEKTTSKALAVRKHKVSTSVCFHC